MRNTFVKVALYAYPFLRTVDKDYEEHIQNRAILSYRSTKTAEELAIAIAEDILEKEKLTWLKDRVEKALQELSDVERTLIGIRYFGKERKKKKPTAATGGKDVDKLKKEGNGGVAKYGQWSERKYFRIQNKLCEKLRAIFVRLGITQEKFEREYAQLELFQKIYAYIQNSGGGVSREEKRWFV